SFRPKCSLDGLAPLSLTRQGNLLQIRGVSHASMSLQQAKVAERQEEAARMILKKLSVPISIDVQYQDTLSAGSGVTLWAIYSLKEEIDFQNPLRLGADGLGEKGVPGEEVGAHAAQSLLMEIESGAAVDSHLADNLIPLLGLTTGTISVSHITEHTKTNISVVEKFLPVKFSVDEEKIIRCAQ
ncbi:hypothetical protein J4457_06395, partial [Candidatus Woesearchaeota archaeon]|nr:hypothetical protein [Candidatus Woesearchaeota archaeon]